MGYVVFAVISQQYIFLIAWQCLFKKSLLILNSLFILFTITISTMHMRCNGMIYSCSRIVIFVCDLKHTMLHRFKKFKIPTNKKLHYWLKNCSALFLSKFHLPSSYGLLLTVSWICWTKGWPNHLMKEEAVYRTAPATTSILNIKKKYFSAGLRVTPMFIFGQTLCLLLTFLGKCFLFTYFLANLNRLNNKLFF